MLKDCEQDKQIAFTPSNINSQLEKREEILSVRGVIWAATTPWFTSTL